MSRVLGGMQPLRVHCFTGGKNGVQHGPLLSARKCFRLAGYYFEWFFMDIDQVKMRGWKPADLVGWLNDGDIYIIASHLHQGLVDTLFWNMHDLAVQLRILYNRVGFPSREQLFCPVFLQNKFAYNEVFLNYAIQLSKSTSEASSQCLRSVERNLPLFVRLQFKGTM